MLLICKLVIHFKVTFAWFSDAFVYVFAVALCLGHLVNQPVLTDMDRQSRVQFRAVEKWATAKRAFEPEYLDSNSWFCETCALGEPT